MKKVFFILGLFILSCNTSEIEQHKSNQTDSVLFKNQKNLIQSDSIQKKSDSTTQKKVIKIVKQITFLTKEVEKYKIERIFLIRELNVAKENVKVRVDTVFVEIKKNFWGKERTNIKVKTDSLVTESIDSNSVKLNSIDTTNHQ